jgi:hypothetical protein
VWDESITRPSGARIWRNGTVPVVYKPTGKQPLLVRLPFRQGNRDWILANGRKIEWRSRWKAWQVPRSRFDGIVELALDRFGSCWLIQEYRPLEKCCPACWNAIGYECECSCLGANHGSGRELEHVVNETFAFEWGEHKLSCRLLERIPYDAALQVANNI